MTLVPILDFIDALYEGDTDTIIRAARGGTPMHPPILSISGEGIPGKEYALSPLLLIRKWNWNEPKSCLEALGALLDAGADPNFPDDLGRRPLPVSLNTLARSLPIQALQMFLDAGADPGLSSFLTDGRSPSTALLECVSAQLEEHAMIILDAFPESAKVGKDLRPPLDLLDDTIGWWKKDAAQRVATRLIQCGADKDIDIESLKAPLKEWARKAIADTTASRMDQSIPSIPETSHPSRVAPRL